MRRNRDVQVRAIKKSTRSFSMKKDTASTQLPNDRKRESVSFLQEHVIDFIDVKLQEPARRTQVDVDLCRV